MNKQNEPSELELAFGRLIISLAEGLKLDTFVRWLSRKLGKLSNLKINLLAFTVAIAMLSILHLLNLLTR